MAEGNWNNNAIITCMHAPNKHLYEILQGGYYYVATDYGNDDLPEGGNGYLIVLQDNTFFKQIFFRMGTHENNDGNMYIRSLSTATGASTTWWKFTGTKITV